MADPAWQEYTLPISRSHDRVHGESGAGGTLFGQMMFDRWHDGKTTSVLNGDTLGKLSYRGWDSAQLTEAVHLRADTTADWTASVHSSRLVFQLEGVDAVVMDKTGVIAGLPWTASGATLTPTDATKTVSVPGGAAGAGSATLFLGSNTAKARIESLNTTSAPWIALCTNRSWITGAQDDATKPSWQMHVDSLSDSYGCGRQAPGGVFQTFFSISNSGQASLPGVPSTGWPALIMGAGTAKGRVQTTNTIPGGIIFSSNRDWTANAQDDATKPSWGVSLRLDTDALNVQRSPAGSTTQTTLLTLDATGQLTLPTNGANNPVIFGSRTEKGRLISHPTASQVYLACNASLSPAAAWVQDTASLQSWMIALDATANGTVTFFRIPPGGGPSLLMMLDNAGNLTIGGPHGYKPSGSTWEVTPSDIRFKQDIAPYTASLTELCALAPIRYRLKSNPDGPLCYGFDAAKVREVFPECVNTRRVQLDPDDAEETDVLALDIHPILIAMVNAIKELAARKH